ncbi:NAD(P)H-hydrate dehydratase [Rubrivivax rivuli]|uniref:Bifunctional NAD(P)H-hydrate repair enzyme n=1 Tax=Rubrivivax rivuli TaxID=1862385 RepID=A0A437RFI6_9BURK|nr:NAD(P)H-hydrate dehydratase [Rubrivivax rivuli]RVU45492.1 NAD(P)H-hydrate dehydratase [Rubrivivax rivuli]
MTISNAPLHVHAGNGPWPLHSAAASQALERRALAQVAPMTLMEAAGLAVARLALAIAPQAGRVVVWVGPGNNGGDGLVAARLLHGRGWRVQVWTTGDPAALPADAHQAWQRAQAAGVPMAPVPLGPEAQGPVGFDCSRTLHIDALLGLGLRRAPAGALAQAIAQLQAAAAGGAPVLAIDLPSGLHPDTGCALGAADAPWGGAVRATDTLSLLTLKPGLFTAQGRDHAGRVWLHRLGVPAGPADAVLSGPPAWAARPHGHHKGSHGDVAVVGGAPGMVGAAWLAASAALAAGAGRVYCSPLDPEAALLDPAHPGLMGRSAWWREPASTLETATVVCGCGGGEAVQAALPPLLAATPRLVLDADALNAIATAPALQALLQARTSSEAQTLLTPHPLEAARLLGCSTAEVQADRVAAAQALVARYGAAVVLKGSGSVIAAPGALPHINPTGNAALASAGTGDVLAGWVAGLWAQAPGASAGEVARQAVWQHGRAADLHEPAARGAPLRAEALIEVLALRALG